MEINDELDSLVKAVIFATKLDVPQIEKRLGYAKGRISQAKSKGQVTDRFLKNIRNEFRVELSKADLHQIAKDKRPATEDSANLSMQSIYNLTQSNKTLAESNKILATSHSDLVQMVKKSERVSAESSLADLSIFSDFLEVLADVASGKRYGSKQQALAELNKFVGAAAAKKKLKGTQSS